MSSESIIKLSSGYDLPAVGLGTGGLKGEEGQDIISKALQIGYRHLDTAEVYGNEVDVGIGIIKSGIPREQVFVTTKAWPNSMRGEEIKKAVYQSLDKLQLDYVDLYLIHWPISFVPGRGFSPIDDKTGLVELENPQVPISETWKALESLVKEGKIRSIGVSNFTVERLKNLIDIATILPTVNQVECHPNFQQNELLDFCKANNIVIMAFTPLGRNNHGAPRLPEHPLIQKLSEELGEDPASILISWAVQRGTAVIPKSTKEHRLRSNLKTFQLSDSVMEILNGMETGKRNIDPMYWGVDIFGDHGGDENALLKAKEILKSKK